MATHQEGGHSAEDREGGAEQVKTKPRSKLAAVGHYVLLGIPPVLSVVAISGAVYAVMGSHTGELQTGKAIAKLESANTALTASLAASKADLEKLKASIAHEKSLQDEERKKQDELMAKIVANISPLQTKLKIKPTLNDQLHQPANTAAAPAEGAGASAELNAPAAVIPHKVTSVPVPAVSHTAPDSHTVKMKSGATASHGSADPERKPTSQAKVLKDAIEQFNKK